MDPALIQRVSDASTGLVDALANVDSEAVLPLFLRFWPQNSPKQHVRMRLRLEDTAQQLALAENILRAKVELERAWQARFAQFLDDNPQAGQRLDAFIADLAQSHCASERVALGSVA